jgi:hypothetical protein
MVFAAQMAEGGRTAARCLALNEESRTRLDACMAPFDVDPS